MARPLLLATVVALVLAAGGGAAGGVTIVFAADRAPLLSGEVYRLDASGTVVDLSRSPFVDEHPVVAPRGGRVAFLSNRDGRYRLYTVGLDGRRLHALPLRFPGDAVDYHWSPDGRALVVVTTGAGALGQGPVDVVREGHVTYLGRTDGAATQVGWTPDGRSVSWVGGGSLHVLDATTGRRLAEVPVRSATTGWTQAGLFAGDDGSGRVVVYDTRGRLVRRFRGSGAAFSFDGALLASVDGRRLELRSARGAVVRTVDVPGRGDLESLQWTRRRTLFVVAGAAAYDVDARTGRLHPHAWPYPQVSASGSTVAWTTSAHDRFAVHVAAADGRTRTVGTVAACTDDGAVIPAVDSLQPTADGRSVVYASRCYELLSNLYGVARGGTVTRLTNAREEQSQPRLSPDGSRLAYVQADATGLSCQGCPSSLWMASASGAGAHALTSPPDCTFDASPSWSPDGTRIVFDRSSCGAPPTLMTISPDGGAAVDLHVPGASPAWGPARIAYLDPTTAPTSVWTMLPDGTGRTRVGSTSGGCAPAWSSDGRLAYCVRGSTVAVVADGRRTTVTLPFVEVVSLAWSGSGGFVVAAKPHGGAGLDLFTVGADGAGARRLTTDLDARF